MKRGVTSIEKAYAAVAVLAVAGLAAVATALAGPVEMPSSEGSAPTVAEMPLTRGTEDVSIASRRVVARSTLTGRRYEPGRRCGERERCGRGAAWTPSS